jgi:hypothetical protein
MIKKLSAFVMSICFGATLFAMPFPTSSMFTAVQMLKTQMATQKQEAGIFSNTVTIRVYKCDEPVAVNVDDRKHAEQKQAIAAKIVDN